jgi:transposase
MAKRATSILLSADEKRTLERWRRAHKTEQRVAERARIILLAAQGMSNLQIAAALGTRPARVSKWRTRFARQRLAGLADEARPGKPRRYNAATEKRILQKLDEAPPSGHATWTGQLLAKALGKVSSQQVWRVLRRRAISLRRRRSCCVSTDPESLWGGIWRPRLVLGASNG